MGRVSHHVLYGEDHFTPHDVVGLHYRYPPVEGIQAPPVLPQTARMMAGLQVPFIPRSEATRESLLGPVQPLTHPRAPGDTGSPGHHLLDSFLEGFASDPYR